jgi:hypothetical protein
MSTTGRQQNLFLAEDWKKIYQTFSNADFSSYDFENLRRVMIQYLREKYPEDFNDYIESSEYLALIDLFAFLGQSLSFRIDLNARENFLELAERRESVLRLAQLISYNPSRNIAANGLLKVDNISTTEEIYDANGRNLSNLSVTWNDSTNSNWADQFTRIMNSAMVAENSFGIPVSNDVIGNIYSEQYKFNTTNAGIPLYSFSTVVNGTSMDFEAVSTIIKDGMITEETPARGNKLSMIFRNDYKGLGSINTGWFMHFKQGNLVYREFTNNSPTTNEIVNINDVNINDDDVWLYGLDSQGNESSLWTKVTAITGNNIIYNSLNKTIRNIYQVQTRAGDTISLLFADGIFGNLPKGTFRVYYRTSNGLTFFLNPKDMKSVNVKISYISKKGSSESLTIGMSLKSVVTNASAAESITDIKRHAPLTYYIQNRMVTGEDYNLAPLSVSQSIAKIKTINRTSSGISRNFDLIDASGKYSSINVFCTDGIIYKEMIYNSFTFTYRSRTEISAIIQNQIQPLVTSKFMRDFYYEKYNKIILQDVNPQFIQATSAVNESSGYIADLVDTLPLKVGSYTASSLKYIEPGALVKFVAPNGFYFDANNNLTTTESSITSTSLWAKVVAVAGDGTASGYGFLSSGFGPIVFDQVIPTSALVYQIIPKFTSTIPADTLSLITELIFNNKNFGLRYDLNYRIWQVVYDRNLNLLDAWSLIKAADNTGEKLDSSWLVAFNTDGITYTVTYRGLEYYFESVLENRFYFDGSRKIYDITTGKVKKDMVSILKFNTFPNSSTTLGKDYPFEIIDVATEMEGYASSRTVKITFADRDDDGTVDDPESFNVIVDDSVDNQNRFVFFEKYTTESYVEDYRYVANTENKFLIFELETEVTNLADFNDGQLFYFYGVDLVKRYVASEQKLVIDTNHYAAIGRNNINFYYLHNADQSYRIDPSASNIMDTYILTKDYDTQYRAWIVGNITEEPLPPSSTELFLTYGSELNQIKSISDEIIYHPVKYRVLFGRNAYSRLQASFKVVKNKEQVITDNEVKARIITAINQYFSVDNWDFGDTFYFTELSTYVMNQLVPYITTFLIVPTNSDQVYGSLQQITSQPNEIFISGATVNDIEVIDAITASKIKAPGYIVTSDTVDINTTLLQSAISKL